jgi:hypothetical protein
MLNAFNATVWTTPLVIAFVMSQCLRRKLRPIARAAMWIIYLLWGWGWVWLWYRYNSGGSGRFAVEQLIFDFCVWGTTLVGAAALGWAELARRGDRAAG